MLSSQLHLRHNLLLFVLPLQNIIELCRINILLLQRNCTLFLCGCISPEMEKAHGGPIQERLERQTAASWERGQYVIRYGDLTTVVDITFPQPSNVGGNSEYFIKL